MADFVVLPTEHSSAHSIIRGSNIHLGTTGNFDYLDLVSTHQPKPHIGWFAADDWSLRLLGNGTRNGCEHFLVLGRPGSDYAQQLQLRMSVEVELDSPVQFLKQYPQTASVFFGTIILDQNSGQVSTMDLLHGCSWMARLGDKIVECNDPSITYTANQYDIAEYMTLTGFGNNGAYMITTNPTLIKFNSSVEGVCPKTMSKFVTLTPQAKLHKLFVKHCVFSDNCSTLPNDYFPTHVLVEGNKFNVNIADVLRERYGITTGPDLSVISNIPHVKNENGWTFDFTNCTTGIISFQLELGNSAILQKLDSDFFSNDVITVMRK